MATAGGEIAAAGCTGFGWEEEGEEEHSGLEPFFFDEAAVRAEHAAAQAAKEKLREKEARERKQLSLKKKAHRLSSIRYATTTRSRGAYTTPASASRTSADSTSTRSVSPLRAFSAIGPMRFTNRVCKPGKRPYGLCDAINILEVNIICSDVGFPIDVYGTVIARDCVDFKCVYLFGRNRDDSELINSEVSRLTSCQISN
nr:unnamed protein product [Digitaria exilis]